MKTKSGCKRSFIMEELEVVIKSFRGDETPCPDGFNLHFFLRCWSTIKDDV